MNNEEKILEMLAEMRSDITEMRGDITEMRGNIAELQADVVELKLFNENTVLPNFVLLSQGHQSLLAALDTLAPKSRVEALDRKSVV